MDGRLPFVITGTHYKIEQVIGGALQLDGTFTQRWRVYERDGDTERVHEEDRPA